MKGASGATGETGATGATGETSESAVRAGSDVQEDPEVDAVTPASAPRRAGRPRDARASRAITDAALRQLSEVGYANMSMESVAAEAGVARATIYRRYQDKADLVTSAMAAGSDRPTPCREPLGDLVDFLEDFDARIAGSCLEVVGSLLGAHADPAALTLHRERVVGPRKGTVVALVAQAKDAGLIRDDADADLLVEMLVGAVFARRIIGLPGDPGWARRAVDAACAGVATPAGIARLREVRPRRRAPARRPGPPSP